MTTQTATTMNEVQKPLVATELGFSEARQEAIKKVKDRLVSEDNRPYYTNEYNGGIAKHKVLGAADFIFYRMLKGADWRKAVDMNSERSLQTVKEALSNLKGSGYFLGGGNMKALSGLSEPEYRQIIDEALERFPY